MCRDHDHSEGSGRSRHLLQTLPTKKEDGSYVATCIVTYRSYF